RDVGATACPGNAFYAFLPTLRQMVAYYVSEPGNPIVPPGLSQAQRNQASMGIPTLLAGPDRVGTALSIARYAFPQGARTVYVANGVNTADALAGGSLTDGPIVLVLNKRDAQAAVA
ncbi:cell wall-binding repeat-containing protein, partial [Mobiluncus curtisii]